MITTIGIIIGIIGIVVGFPPFIEFVKLHKKKKNKFKQRFSKLSFSEKIVLYIWYFPVENQNQSSWAVKESQVILGNLENAKKNPGLGIAILSIEFALTYFKEQANSRILNCINWGIIRTQKKEPYFILYEKRDESITKIEYVPDFRHTIAFGIILSKTRRKLSHIDEYLKYLVNNQHNDGGWTAGKGHTISELFSCIYAIELIVLNRTNKKVKSNYDNVIKKAVIWLVNNISNDYLWKSNVFDEYWDMIFSSTWVLNRLIPLNLEELYENWSDIVNKISLNLLDNHQKIDWNTKDKFQKFRLETRIAAALYKGQAFNYYNSEINEQVESFIREWKERTIIFMQEISFDDLDLATSLFLAEPLLGYEIINDIVEKKLK